MVIVGALLALVARMSKRFVGWGPERSADRPRPTEPRGGVRLWSCSGRGPSPGR